MRRGLLPGTGSGGVRFSPLKCIETHDITHLHPVNQKKVKYSMKSATRTFRRRRRKFSRGLCGPNASRKSSRTNTQICTDVEKDYGSVLMYFSSPEHALAAR